MNNFIMMKKFSLLKIILKLSLLLTIKSNNLIDPNDKIIRLSEDQGYNIRIPQDHFFNDICQYYSSEYKTDVSLEYRRKYYYYPNGKQLIINNNYKINEVFSEPKRNNIFLCFKYYLDIYYLYKNICLYFIVFIFLFQILILIIYLCGRYKNASEYTPEAYLNYLKNNKNKNTYNIRNIINKYFVQGSSQNINQNENENDNTKETFSKFQEENNNEYLNNNINNHQNLKEKIKNGSNIVLTKNIFLNPSIEIKNNEENNSKKDELNTTGDFQHNLDEIDDNDIDIEQQFHKANINPDEIYTFGGLRLDIDNKEDSNKKKMISEESQKEEKTKYVFNKINNINNTNNTQIKENKYNNNNTQVNQIVNNILTKEELFYSGYSVVILQDKRTFKEIYFDILSHCQIIYYFLQNFYIYEDTRLTFIYYTIKLFLYFILTVIFLNDISIINQIYDHNFTYSSYFFRSLIITIIANILSQFLFLFTNSKRMYIRYNNKIKNSLFGKKRIIKYVLKDIVELINYNLFWKILFLFFICIFIFCVSFFLSICFCIAYYNTQFIAIKCIILCIMISQICPFFLALIPAKLRKKSIETKSNKLFMISQTIDSYFLP